MSFLFNWMDLKVLDLKSSINSMLSSVSMEQLPQQLSISSLSLGNRAPKFELLEIVDLNKDKFKGLFKFQYDGELNVVFKTDYEANAIKMIDFDMFTKPKFVLCDRSTFLPVEFKIKNVKIDSILTVVYNGRITAVFNDDPFIDLDIETSLDEFLDDELFQIIKQDTLNLVTILLKQDLPEMLHSFIPDEDLQNAPVDTIVSKPEDDVLNSSTLSLFDYPTSFKLQQNLFDTFSLEPQGFTDAIQRTALSKLEFQNMETHKTDQLGQKKRRVIKMNTKHRSKRASTSKHNDNLLSPPDITPNQAEDIQTSSPSSSPETIKIPQSESSATTLIDTTFSSISSNSLDDYLNEETLSTSQHASILEKLDPYESLTHPMDLLPCYEKNELENLKILSMNKENRDKGRPSSNYINLNNDYKEFMMNKQEMDIGSDDDEVFYDFE